MPSNKTALNKTITRSTTTAHLPLTCLQVGVDLWYFCQSPHDAHKLRRRVPLCHQRLCSHSCTKHYKSATDLWAPYLKHKWPRPRELLSTCARDRWSLWNRRGQGCSPRSCIILYYLLLLWFSISEKSTRQCILPRVRLNFRRGWQCKRILSSLPKIKSLNWGGGDLTVTIQRESAALCCANLRKPLTGTLRRKLVPQMSHLCDTCREARNRVCSSRPLAFLLRRLVAWEFGCWSPVRSLEGPSPWTCGRIASSSSSSASTSKTRAIVLLPSKRSMDATRVWRSEVFFYNINYTHHIATPIATILEELCSFFNYVWHLGVWVCVIYIVQQNVFVKLCLPQASFYS